jgi:hypothetical protein
MNDDSSRASEPVFRFEPDRYRLEDERSGKTWKLVIGDLLGVQMGTEENPPPGRGYYVKAYVNTGEYPDGGLGEVFITPDKEGSFAKGVLDGFALLLSIALQHGISLEDIAAKYLNMRFEPSGYTTDDAIPMASSFFDFMFRKLALEYLDDEALERLGVQDRTKYKTNICTCQEDDDGTDEDQGASTELRGKSLNNSKEIKKTKLEATRQDL